MYKLRVWFGKHFFAKSDAMDNGYLLEGVKAIPKGHTVFEYDYRDTSLRVANCFMDGNKKVVLMRKTCTYVSALSRDKAREKIIKKGLVIKARKPYEKKTLYGIVGSQPIGTRIYFVIEKSVVKRQSRLKRILFILKSVKWKKM